MRSDIEAAILGMYDSIERAREVQAAAGHSDQGARQGITSGKHLDPIAAIIRDDLINAGFHPDEVYDQGRMCTLPGWFRPTHPHQTAKGLLILLKMLLFSGESNPENLSKKGIAHRIRRSRREKRVKKKLALLRDVLFSISSFRCFCVFSCRQRHHASYLFTFAVSASISASRSTSG